MRMVIATIALAIGLAACTGAKSPETGTLTIRLSDHRIAIGDFERLDITIQSIGLHPAGAPRSGSWLDFAPDTPVVDLTQVVGDLAVTVLQADIPAGDYNAVRLVVSAGEGMLKAGGAASVPGFEEAAVYNFSVQAGAATTLLLDVIVQSADDHPGDGYEMHLLSVTSP